MTECKWWTFTTARTKNQGCTIILVVVVYITEGHLKFTDQNGKVKEVYAKAGEARFFPPFKHKVENMDDKPVDAVYIGLKIKPAEKN